MPSSGRENLGWKIGEKAIGAEAVHRGRTDVVEDAALGRPRVYLEIAIGGAPAGRVVCELYSDVVPRTAENFRSLCTGGRGMGKRGKPLHYMGCGFHRIIPNFMVQGGDITHGDGTGGESIFGQTFADENLQLQHIAEGMLSMANSGKNTNGSQFFITCKPCPHLDGKHVVFGRVIDGLDVVKRMEACGTADGGPSKSVRIDDCGEVRGSRSAEEGRPAKRRRADLPGEIRVLQILKKHKDCSDPKTAKGEVATCTKGRAKLGLTNVRKRLMANPGAMEKSFAEAAREHSDCEFACKGGDLGVVEQGTLEKDLELVAFALSAGELSEPFETPEGVHMVLRVA